MMNDVKHPSAYSNENIYFMLHQKYIPIEDYKNSTQKMSLSNCIREMMN